MSTSYVPTRDSDLQIWSLNFATTLTANPANYGLTAGDAAAVAAAQAAYSAAYVTATTQSTRTKDTIAAKDVARGQLTVLLRTYSDIIQANAGISQDNKTALGLPIRKTTKTAVTAPTSAPTINVTGLTAGVLQMTYHDPNQGAKVKAKPAGAIQMEVAYSTSTTVVTDPTTLGFRELVTKTPFNLPTDPSDKGKTLYFAGRWVTRRGLMGPWSAVGSTVVA